MQKLDINGAEVLRIKLRLEDITDNINDTFSKMGSEINNCANNLVNGSDSSSLVIKVQGLIDRCENIKVNMVNDLNVLSTFMAEQMQEYSASTEDASKAITSLISYMQSTITTGKAPIDNPNAGIFNDSDALSRGEANYDDLVVKMPNKEQWDIMNECHDFFIEKGLTEEQVAGILGNACLESGFNLDAKNSTSTSTGLFQWLNSRWPSDWSLDTQLNHAWEEMQGAPCGGNITSVVDELKECQTVSEASNIVAIYFEGAGTDSGIAAGYGRKNYANTIYYYYSNK